MGVPERERAGLTAEEIGKGIPRMARQ